MPLAANMGPQENSEEGNNLMLSFNIESFPFWNLHDVKQTHHELLCPLPVIAPWITAILRYLFCLL